MSLGEAISMRIKQGLDDVDWKWSDTGRHLNDDEQAFLRRWADQLSNQKWERITSKQMTRNEHEVVHGAIKSLRAARADHEAGADEQRREYTELIRMAQSADEMAEYFRRRETEQIRVDGTGWEALHKLGDSLEDLIRLHKREAEIFRELAGPREPTPSSLHISRNDTGWKGKRSREQDLFMQHMSQLMLRVFNKEHDNVVAEIANLAYPHSNITKDHVRDLRRAKDRPAVGR
jgi:hypothetical protein